MKSEHKKAENKRLYGIWSNMKTRCYNPKVKAYQHYGGRGIEVCKEWQKYDVFYRWAMSSGYQDNLTLDRIDSDENYCPENCRWATQKEQQNNRRNNHLLTYNGVTRTLKQWEEICGIDYSLIKYRLKHGYSVCDALFTPPKKPKLIEFDGESHTVSEWSKITGIRQLLINDRLRKGWSVERTLTEKPFIGKNQSFKGETI